MTQNTSRVTGVLILLIAVIGGAYLYFQRPKSPHIEKFNAKYREAVSFHMRGDYTSAIEMLVQLQKNAPTKEAEAGTKRKLASSRILRNLGSDRDEAIKLYKEIINDPAVPAIQRALALSDMAFVLDRTGDGELMERSVFSEEPYATYLKESGTGILGAVRRIYEKSDALYPTAFAKLEISFKYAVGFLNGGSEPGLTSKEVSQLIRQNIDAALPLLSSLPHARGELTYMYMMRAVSLSAVERIIHGTSFTEIEAEYQRAISTANGTGAEDVYSRQALMRSSLFYAIDLALRYDDSRRQDIQGLLRPLLAYDPRSREMVAFAERNKSRPEGNYMRRGLVELVKISPELGAFLSKAGWSI